MEFTLVGARGRIESVEDLVDRLRSVASELGLEVQAFDADMVFGRDHIASALEHARRAFERGSNVATSLMMEVLVYASGERQISTALEKMGVKEGSDGLVVLAVGGGDVDRLLEGVGLERDDSLIEPRREMLPAFGISEMEMETVPQEEAFDLVLERVAIVDVMK
jgi:KEOPS complex subunit Cgi121